MAGLDIPSRAEVARLLGQLNAAGNMRIVLVLRNKPGDTMPDWITDICEVRDGDAWIGSRAEWEKRVEARPTKVEEIDDETTQAVDGEPVIMLDDVSVSYGEGTRPVSVVVLSNTD